MKRRAALVALAAACACQRKPAPPASATAAAADDGVAAVAKALAIITATCARAAGTVEVQRTGHAEWEPLALGGVLRGGDVVRTGPASSARIAFVSGGVLELEESATVEIGVVAPEASKRSDAGKAEEGTVAVREGVVRGVLPAAEGARALGLVIRGLDGSATRLAAAKGSGPAAFRVTRAAGGTEVAITKGEVHLGAPGGQKLRAGRAIEVSRGGMGRVIDLLEFPASVEPGIDARFHWTKDLEIRLAWKPVANAAGYRVQISRTLSFETVTNTLEVQATDASFRPPAEGMYAWRVASRDAAGRYGEYGFARRVYCERDLPRDLLVGPSDRETVKYSEAVSAVTFTWQSAANAKVYKVVVATAPDLLEHPVVSRLTLEQRLQVKGLAPGEYFWGVFVDDGPSPEAIFQKPRALTLQRVPRAKVKVPKIIREWGN